MTTDKLHLRSGPVTQAMFERLPALLTAWQVKEVTGWDDAAITEAVRAGQLQAWAPPARPGCQRSYRKYLKVSVGRIVGFKC